MPNPFLNRSDALSEPSQVSPKQADPKRTLSKQTVPQQAVSQLKPSFASPPTSQGSALTLGTGGLTLAPQAPLQSPAPVLPEMRSFGDMAATRKAIFDRSLKAASGLSVVENQRYALSLGDLHYAEQEDPTPDRSSPVRDHTRCKYRQADHPVFGSFCRVIPGRNRTGAGISWLG